MDQEQQAVPVEHLRPGTVVADKFVIEGLLAAGSMGSVYRARQEPMGREVALKVMLPHLDRKPSAVKRFFQEAVAVSKLKHPNSITLFDFGRSQDDRLYLAMELIEGRSLKEILVEWGRLGLQRTVRIISQVALSLAEAHRQGIIHRDLKPANILLVDLDGQPDFVKVIDFGIAQLEAGPSSERLTMKGFTCGTPAYMSPEQLFEGREVDARSDLFTVGVMMYEMLEGRRPFQADNVIASMERRRSGSPDAMSDDHPKSIRDFVARLLANDPEDRPSSAEDLVRELEAALPPGVRLHLIELALDERSKDTVRVDVPDLDPEADSDTIIQLKTLTPGLQTLVHLGQVRRIEEADSSPDPPQLGSVSPVTGAPWLSSTTKPPASGRPWQRSVTAPTGSSSARRRSLLSLTAVLVLAVGIALALWLPSDSSRRPPSPAGSPAAAAEAQSSEAAGDGARAAATQVDRHRPLGLAAPCTADEACASANCSDGRCAPAGFAYLSPGSFVMGVDGSSEAPRHEVTITRPFYLSRTETTQGEWRRLMERLNTEDPNCGDECPAEYNRWIQAIEYLNRLSERDGLDPCYEIDRDDVSWPQGLDCRGYRLPTEAEWEYAARAGTRTDYPCGDRAEDEEDDCLLEIAWIRDNSGASLHPVGQKPPNAFGLHDIIGSAWEYVWDRYGPYEVEPEVDPLGPDTGRYRIRRGCSYESTHSACETGGRNTYGRAGLRVARSAFPPPE